MAADIRPKPGLGRPEAASHPTTTDGTNQSAPAPRKQVCRECTTARTPSLIGCMVADIRPKPGLGRPEAASHLTTTDGTNQSVLTLVNGLVVSAPTPTKSVCLRRSTLPEFMLPAYMPEVYAWHY